MIISRTPLRVTLGGGGTDLPSYYSESGGFLIAAAITKYIYVAVHDNFEPDILLKYAAIERVRAIQEIKHPLIREALSLVGINKHIEITSMADIPAGTGLGSSGSFTVGLLKALYAYERRLASNHELADLACHLEIERLNEPVGKQDQFIAALGGLSALTFHTDGTVEAASVDASRATHDLLQENLLLFYTGVRRSAIDELRAMDDGVINDAGTRANLDDVKASGQRTCAALEVGDLQTFGSELTHQWQLKFERSPSAIHKEVDRWIHTGIAAGAAGGKLVGAGGGGFLLFYAQDKPGLRAAMAELGLPEVAFGIDYVGASLVVQ
jgi:D-glycero-alpha-D-manno-heptose-7-phosphate kinase